MGIRAKMILRGIDHNDWGGAQATFTCHYDTSNPEDVGFCQATPSGEAKFSIDNPKAVEQLVAGKQYYFDISPVE